MTNKVRTAVLPAAGAGTRMRPATRAVPKELLPVGGRPAIQWVVEEAACAGIERIVVVSSPAKPALDAYFETKAHVAGVARELAGIAPRALERCRIEIVHQHGARGLGDAVRVARRKVPNEPLAVLLPDEILLGGSRLLTEMLEDYERTEFSVVSLLAVPRPAIGAYGCAELARPVGVGRETLVTGCVEKPAVHEAPSSYALSGRYVVDLDVLDAIEQVAPDDRGEIQLTAALHAVARKVGLVGAVVLAEDGRVDVGNWRGWLDANVRALSEEVLGELEDARALVTSGGRRP